MTIWFNVINRSFNRKQEFSPIFWICTIFNKGIHNFPNVFNGVKIWGFWGKVQNNDFVFFKGSKTAIVARSIIRKRKNEQIWEKLQIIEGQKNFKKNTINKIAFFWGENSAKT